MDRRWTSILAVTSPACDTNGCHIKSHPTCRPSPWPLPITQEGNDASQHILLSNKFPLSMNLPHSNKSHLSRMLSTHIQTFQPPPPHLSYSPIRNFRHIGRRSIHHRNLIRLHRPASQAHALPPPLSSLLTFPRYCRSHNRNLRHPVVTIATLPFEHRPLSIADPLPFEHRGHFVNRRPFVNRPPIDSALPPLCFIVAVAVIAITLRTHRRCHRSLFLNLGNPLSSSAPSLQHATATFSIDPFATRTSIATLHLPPPQRLRITASSHFSSAALTPFHTNEVNAFILRGWLASHFIETVR